MPRGFEIVNIIDIPLLAAFDLKNLKVKLKIEFAKVTRDERTREKPKI